LQIGGPACGNLRGLRRLFLTGGGLARAGVFQQLQCVTCLFATAKTRRTEENHRVLNLFSPETRERLHVLRNDADQAPVGAVQEG
jgi:hypothetical protein